MIIANLRIILSTLLLTWACVCLLEEARWFYFPFIIIAFFILLFIRNALQPFVIINIIEAAAAFALVSYEMYLDLCWWSAAEWVFVSVLCIGVLFEVYDFAADKKQLKRYQREVISIFKGEDPDERN